MVTRAIEGKALRSGWTAITVDRENRVISLNLRENNNLIIYDQWDDEIYVDLQLEDWIEPTDAFPVWITTGRVLVADWWDLQWTLICAKTTSWDNIKLLYGDNWQLFIDNGSWTFKQIYLKPEVDALLLGLRQSLESQITAVSNRVSELELKVTTLESKATVIDSTEPSTGVEWQLRYDTTNDVLCIYDWTQWVQIGNNTPPL